MLGGLYFCKINKLGLLWSYQLYYLKFKNLKEEYDKNVCFGLKGYFGEF